MMQDASLRTLPLIDTESDERNDSDYHGRQGACVGPSVQTTSETGACDKEGQSSSEKAAADQVDVAYLAPERQMI